MYDYKKLKINKYTIDEHRYIMQNIIGRKLDFNEVIHHIDGNKRNNDVSNLEIMQRSEHSRIHMKGRKVKESTIKKMADKYGVHSKKSVLISNKEESHTFISIKDAAIFLNVSPQNMSRAVNYNYKCKGYICKFN